MYYISHRGNIEYKDVYNENSIKSIDKCLSMNLDVEIDVWYSNKNFYLGHDNPKTLVTRNYLENPKLWCHAKNYQALFEMHNTNIHYFWHNNDDYTITSKGFLWVFPGKTLNKNCIAVLPEKTNYNNSILSQCLGICSDQIIRYIDAKN